MNKKTIIVLGQRRSGTSMVSGILHNLGIPIGFAPGQVSEFNPKGYFEDRRLIFLSETMMAFTMGKWGFLRFDASKKNTEKLKKYFDSWIKEVIKEKEKDGNVWGFKDVNHILFEDVYRPFLNNPKYIVIKRNKESIKKSLSNWHKQSPEAYNNMVDFYELLLDGFVDRTKDPILSLNYEECLEKKLEMINKIIKFVGIKPTQEQINKTLEFITPDLNHYEKN